MLLPSIRSLKTGSLLLATLAASTLPSIAGDTTIGASTKDKNPVIEKPKTDPRFYVELLAGGEFDIHATHFVSNGIAAFPNPGLAAPVLAPGALLPAQIQSRDFQSTHDVGVINGRFELGYKVLPYLSVFTGFTYSHSGGNNERPLGVVIDQYGIGGPAGGRYDLFASVGQYQAFAGMGGIKLNTPRTLLDLLHIPKAIKPYASISAGGKYLDSQHIRFYNGAGGGVAEGGLVDTGRLSLYDSSWVFTAEAELGYELQLTRNFSVNFESGYGYDSAPERGSLAPYISGVNKGGDRLYSTVSLGAKLSF